MVAPPPIKVTGLRASMRILPANSTQRESNTLQLQA